jgi:hypothetical protein
MTAQRRPSRKRDGERGAVAIVFAAVIVGLFAMAAMAVDSGFQYQAQRSLQAAADSAVLAGLPAMSTANAIAMAGPSGSGYPTANIGASVSGNNLTVTISAVQPRFFGSAFGIPAKTLHVTSVGQRITPLPAVFALASSCSAVGVRFDGGQVTVTGAMKSAGSISLFTGPVAVTNGPISYGPSCPAPSNHGEAFAGGAPAPAAAGPDPLGYTLANFPVANCSFGTNYNPGNVNVTSLPGVFQSGNAGGGVLNTGVICSGGDINLSGSSLSGTITMVAVGNINTSGTNFTLTAAPNGKGLVAFSLSNAGDGGSSGCISPSAIALGSSSWTVNGGLYAPNGCIDIGGSGITINGSLIGLDVNPHGSVTINSTSGGAGGSYLYQ